MSKRILKSFIGATILGLMVSGCSVKGKRDETESKKPPETAAKPIKKVEPKPEPIEPKKPDVEVIKPIAADQPKVTLEPIPEAKPEPIPEPIPESKPEESKAPEQKAVEPVLTEPEKAEPKAQAESLPERQLAHPEDKAAPKKSVPVSSGSDHFVVTAQVKDSSHPHFNKGHKMGFVVNGEPGKELVMERNKTYRMEVATDPKHDVYLSTKEIGWGSSPWTDGVQGAFIYNGVITIKLDKKAPQYLYYSCRNHPFMGGKIHVVNPGQKVVIKKKATKAAVKAAAPKKAVNAAMVNQKLMFAQMLLGSKSGKSLSAEDRGSAEGLMSKAKKQLKAGQHQQAYTAAEQALGILKNKKAKSGDVVDNEKLKTEYKELSASIKDFEKSHASNYKRIAKKDKSKAVDYDKKTVAKLKKDAESAANKGDYAKANKNLNKAQNMVTKALQTMLNSTTIVYDLNFETPQEEYEYELKRFGGYEELIPVAIEAKKPTEGAKQLMQTYLEKGRKMRAAAVKKAANGDYPVAIAMLLDATKQVRRALRMVGVMQ